MRPPPLHVAMETATLLSQAHCSHCRAGFNPERTPIPPHRVTLVRTRDLAHLQTTCILFQETTNLKAPEAGVCACSAGACTCTLRRDHRVWVQIPTLLLWLGPRVTSLYLGSLTKIHILVGLEEAGRPPSDWQRSILLWGDSLYMNPFHVSQ